MPHGQAIDLLITGIACFFLKNLNIINLAKRNIPKMEEKTATRINSKKAKNSNLLLASLELRFAIEKFSNLFIVGWSIPGVDAFLCSKVKMLNNTITIRRPI